MTSPMVFKNSRLQLWSNSQNRVYDKKGRYPIQITWVWLEKTRQQEANNLQNEAYSAI